MTRSWPPDDYVEALAAALWKEFTPPYMARSADFTDEQVTAGELRRADEEADAQNLAVVRRALLAAGRTGAAETLPDESMVGVPRSDLAEWAKRVEAASRLLGEMAGGTARDALHQLAGAIALRAVERSK